MKINKQDKKLAKSLPVVTLNDLEMSQVNAAGNTYTDLCGEMPTG